MQSNAQQDDRQSRQEILDFLRQLQDRDEKAARASGINTWLLIATSCYVGLWLIKNTNPTDTPKLLTLGLSASLAVVLYFLALRPANRLTHSKARATTVLDLDNSYSLLTIVSTVIFIPLPTAGGYLFHGWIPSVIFGAFLSVIVVLFVSLNFSIKILNKNITIRAINEDSKAVNLTIELTILGFAIYHSGQVLAAAKALTPNQIEYFLHTTALWWILWKLVDLSSTNNRSKKYVHLEEELIFRISTPESILKKLENTIYGPSIEEDLINLEEEIKIQHENFQNKVMEFNAEIEEIRKIPATYKHEIMSRTHEALRPIEVAVSALTDKMNAKIDYINSFKGLRKSGLNEVARRLLEKEREAVKYRLSAVKSDVSQLRNQISALTETNV